MDLRRLQVFTKVYEHRSFSRAAEDVLLSQPTVSGHIKTLEEDLAVRLFDRLGREIMPTKAAELLYGHARRVLEAVDQAQEAVDAFLGRLRGELVVGGSTIPGQYVLPAFIGRFRLLYPELRVILKIGGTSEIAARVLSGELEAGVVGAVIDDERLAFTPVMDDELCVIAWPDHPLAGRQYAIKVLAEEPVVMREPGSGTRMFLAQALKRSGLDIADLQVAAEMGSTMAVLQAVRAKVGLGFISQRAVTDDLAAGRVVKLKFKGLKLARKFYLVTRHRRTHAPAAQAFIGLWMADLGGGQPSEAPDALDP